METVSAVHIAAPTYDSTTSSSSAENQVEDVGKVCLYRDGSAALGKDTVCYQTRCICI